MLPCSFTKEEVQVNHPKQKQLPPQKRFATFNHNDQMRPIFLLVIHEPVHPSENHYCHPKLIEFSNDHSPFVILETKKFFLLNIRFFFVYRCTTSPKSKQKSIKKNNKTSLQQSVVLYYTNFTDKDNPFERRILRDNNLFYLGLNLTTNWWRWPIISWNINNY